MINDLRIEGKKETDSIIAFIKDVLKKSEHQKVVIGWSGGIDSTTALYLLQKTLLPKNIVAVHLPYFPAKMPKLPFKVQEISIKPIADVVARTLQIDTRDTIRMGNIMARVRMIVLYDLAKKHKAMVCGTENRSEHYLGYFTRFGDEASDLEPIRHLFKTQVYQLAKYLSVPVKIINQSPTAGLWQGQTDEGEFGFTYEEADQVLHLHYDKNLTLKEITRKGFKNAKKIVGWVKKNDYKHQTPYVITQK